MLSLEGERQAQGDSTLAAGVLSAFPCGHQRRSVRLTQSCFARLFKIVSIRPASGFEETMGAN